jgi:hypothetical protein
MKARALLSEWLVGVIFGPILMVFALENKDGAEAIIGAALFVVGAAMWALWRQDEIRRKADQAGERTSDPASS